MAAGIVNPDPSDSRLITLEDLFATVADLLDKSLPAEVVDSESFLPALRDEHRAHKSERMVMSSLSNKLIIRQWPWKLICVGEKELLERVGDRKKQEDEQAAAEELPWHRQIALYNLEDDPGESTNVAGEQMEVASHLAHLAIQAFTEGMTTTGPTLAGTSASPQIELLRKILHEFADER